MDLRRKKPTDIAGVKRSRSALTGAVTKAWDKLKAMPYNLPEEVQQLKFSEIKNLLKTLSRTAAGYTASQEEAQEFSPEDEAEEVAFQEEEDEAAETFFHSLQTAQEFGESLLAYKNILLGIKYFKTDLDALQQSLDEKPEQDCSLSLTQLQELFSSLRKQWTSADLNPDHPIKAELDACVKSLPGVASTVHLAKTRTSGPPAPSHLPHHYIELPKIKVPTFEGDLMGWSTFWATFRSTVHDRSELSNTQKLNYLRQAITDPSLQLLLNSPLESSETYTTIIQELQDRFQKTREIHRTIVKTLTSLSHPKHTRKDLRLHYDLVKTNIANLKATKQYDIESFLSSMIYATLPGKLQLLWDQATKKDKKVPPVAELLNFLKDHAETLPSLDKPPAEKIPESTNNQSPPQNNIYTQHSVHVATPTISNYQRSCALCAPEKHPLYFCPKWASYTVVQKIAHISTNNLCSNCLAGGHTQPNCKSSYKCKECGQRHHTSIHQHPATTPVNHSSSVSHQVPDALMATAQLVITGPSGKEFQARALLDSGAGISLVSDKVTKMLNLPLQPTKLQLSVAQGEKAKPLHHMTSINISPLHNRAMKIPCHPAVSTTVTSNLPPQPVKPVIDLPHLMGLQLADTSYHLPGEIDLLLGADMAPLIMTPKPLRCGKTTEPIAQSTHFGWVLSGPVTRLNLLNQEVTNYQSLNSVCFPPSQTRDVPFAGHQMLNLPPRSNHHFTSINNLQSTAAGKRNSSAKRVPAEPLLPLPLDASRLLRPGQSNWTPNSSSILPPMAQTAADAFSSTTAVESSSPEVFTSGRLLGQDTSVYQQPNSRKLLGQDTSVYQQLQSTPPFPFYPVIFYPIPPLQPPPILPLPLHHIPSLHRQPAPGRMFRQEGLHLPILPLAEQTGYL